MYPIDIERRFSDSPFAHSAQQGLMMRPSDQLIIDLPADQRSLRWQMPEAWRGQHLVMSLQSASGDVGSRQMLNWHYSSMQAIPMPQRGQVQVLDDQGKRLAAAHVKVYARFSGGKVKFYKDGYTDLRGRFDYQSVSGTKGLIERFAVLIMHPEHGATVMEITPAR